MGARGFRVLKKLRKLKMKTRQYDTDEAGDYGDAVPVLLEILHNSQPRTQGIRQLFRPGCTCCSDTLDTTPLFVSSWRNFPAP